MAGASGSAPPSRGAGQVTCPNGTCGALRFTFESDTAEGFVIDASGSGAASGSPVATTFDGKRVLRADMRVEGNSRNRQLRRDICGSDAVDLRRKTLTAIVRLEGPALPATDGEHSLSLYVWTRSSSFFVGQEPMPAASGWYTVRGPLDRAENEEVYTVGVYAYVNGSGAASGWTGSLYVDDVVIE